VVGYLQGARGEDGAWREYGASDTAQPDPFVTAFVAAKACPRRRRSPTS
jgi:hypothetical protein